MMEDTLFLPGLSAVDGKQVQVAFAGGPQSSDGGVLLLREVDRRLGLAERLAACIPEWRRPSSPSPLPLGQRTIHCRILTPAQPDYPAASLRDFLSGA
jgi:hypothetical protein